MAAFSAFRPYVMPDVPGCPQVMIDDAIRGGCRQFAFDTWAVRYDVPAFNTVDATQSYVLTPPSQHEIFSVAVVVKDGEDPALSPVIDHASVRYVQTAGSPTFFWYKSTALWLFPTPNVVVNLEVEAVIRPTQAATTVDDQFLEYRDAVAAWAKYKLMMVSGKSWYNPSDAKENYALYMKLMGDQKVRSSNGRVAAPLRAMADFF